MNMTKEELRGIIDRHGNWVRDEDGGERANLGGANLGEAYLEGANLRGANLRGANLRVAYLGEAYLGEAYLEGANLGGANLERANLGGANLRGAYLGGAYLEGANLEGANLEGANLGGVVGGNSRIQCLQVSPYRIVILDKSTVWGGCTKKTVQEWLEYEGEELNQADRTYLETVTKPFIRMVCKLNESKSNRG